MPVQIEPDRTLVIEDPGHGMTPEEISTLYTRMARGGSRDGGGIGLALISRLCEHLQWRLEFSARAARHHHHPAPARSAGRLSRGQASAARSA